jgi:phage tail sheath protein FI
MGFQLSPGVQVSEIDLTTIVPSVATSIGGIAGIFAWGPVNEVVTISDEVRLVDRFGKPNNNNAEYWFSAANFLAYSNTLKVVRAANSSTTLNATTGGTGIFIENEDDYEANHSAGANTNGQWAARWPGDLGNSIRVELVDSGTYTGWTYESSFTAAPNTSTQAASVGGSQDELHIIVIDELGKFTGTPNTVLEKYEFVSKASDAKTFDGTSNYYKNVINTRSRYIWWLAHPNNVDLSGAVNWGGNSATTFVTTSSVVDGRLTGGSDGSVSTGDLVRAYDAFANSDTIDVNLLISGPAGATIANHLIDNIAESRKDCVVFISPEKSDVVNNYGDEVTDSVAFRNTLTSSSYAVMDSNWKYQFDKYNDVYRWIPLNGDIAGLCARTDQDRDPWYSPGGLNRGIIKNVVKLAWNPNKTDRDGLYVAGINPVVTFAGEGTVLFGDKTLLARPSAFDRINVRRLFIVLEKAIARAARSSLFEFNDTFTRAQFVNLVEPFLRDVQGRRGIFDFRVVCDETNNTGEVIDRNEFIGDIYIKPARSINFIQLNFVAVRTGVSFDEVVGKFG